MAAEQPIKVFDIWPGKNRWEGPTYSGMFGIQLEGYPPPDDEIERRKQLVAQRRNGWSPDSDGWRQLQEITNAVVRRRVLVKIWDSILMMLDEDEGPSPVMGFCTDVETRPDETGALQAYLRLEHPRETATHSGFGEGRGRTRMNDGSEWINLGALYEIQVLPLLVGSESETRES